MEKMVLYAPTPGLTAQGGAENETQAREAENSTSCPQRQGGAEREDAAAHEILITSAAHATPQMGTRSLRA